MILSRHVLIAAVCAGAMLALLVKAPRCTPDAPHGPRLAGVILIYGCQ